MAQVRIGIIGAGWPGNAHARGYREAGGFKIVAAIDPIPPRLQKLKHDFGIPKEYPDLKSFLKDPEINAVSICVPTSLHASITLAALRAKKHVLCETPPALSASEAKKIEKAASKAQRVVLYGFQRRFGGPELAARQAISKQYAGNLFHCRASWMRTRSIPKGTGGWFTRREQSGGGALIDIGAHMLDLAWYLLGQPRPLAAFGTTNQKFGGENSNVEDSAFALIRFEGGQTVELSTSWAINQPPHQQGTTCRLYGDSGALDVYTAHGAQLYRNYDEEGNAKSNALPPPRVIGHAAMMRHFRDCIQGNVSPIIGPREGVVLMNMIEAIYRSAETGKSVAVR